MADKKISALTASTTPLAGTEVLPIVQSGATVKVSVANLTAGRDISATGLTVSSNTGNIELNWAAGSTHKVGSTFSTSFFTGMRVDADTRNTDIVSFDASGNGNVRIRTGTTETTRLNADPTGNITVNTGNLIIGTSGKGIDFSATPGTGTSELLADYEEGTWTPSVGGSATYAAANSGRYTRIGRKVFIEGILEISVLGTGSVLDISGLPFTSNATDPGGAVTIAYWAGMSTPLVYLAGAIANNSSVISMRYAVVSATSLSFSGVFANGSRVDFTGSYTV
jgi:hypothetical protein